ncbi:amidohydrolase [Ciceribacter sp. L1K22]|uniref:amidohydrolase n=1 Tax=Ciceribacter sp. L1K22 TaxID=2820275 RepID=UPI001ABE1073|nr:amidohydrolase [Ciceribacter sp. L1K22]MBO3760937.1 amidohydrolase [Ciceribacter sp. L1K22]
MFLTNQDLVSLIDLRHELHRFPEVSGDERETAARVVTFLKPLSPARILTDLGGHGVAAVFDSGSPGPTLLFRSELDALPIEELSDAPHRSTIAGKGHLCGHDGHSTILTAMAIGLSRQPPKRGRVVLLFQPAEENGAGAAAVIADPRFSEIVPDFAFSLHNMPGLPLGHVALTDGPVNCASRGMRIRLTGKTSHASEPEKGVSPMQAVARLMPALAALSHSRPPAPDFLLVTITHAELGEPAFGISPGAAEIWATLRTLTDDRMDALIEAAEILVHDAARKDGLQVEIGYEDVFHHCENAPEAVAHLERALATEGIPFGPGDLPMRASEDFGRFRQHAPTAMFFLGAGERHPALHNPDYDFPDDLISTGSRVFMRVVRDILG